MTGLYIHIPYCHSKCAYCDFYSTPQQATLSRMVEALAREWQLRRSELPSPPSTLYLGGGTPSILSIPQLTDLVNALGRRPWVESTIECNPEDVSAEWIEAVKGLGFTRVSMGVQSLDDAQLAFIGRRHTAVKAIESARMLLNSGLDVSLDLIYGLPGQTLASWTSSLQQLLDLKPHHLSAYLLSYEPGTKLYAMLQAGKVEEAPEELATEMYQQLCRLTRAAGYEHYEVSNFCQPNHRAIHNSNYWSGQPYLGLGPGAHSFDGDVRRINPSSIKSYLAALEGGQAACEVDVEDLYDKLNDVIITRLRTVDGLSLDELEQTYGHELAAKVVAEARSHIERGELTWENGRLRIAEASWLCSDAIMRDLIQLP